MGPHTELMMCEKFWEENYRSTKCSGVFVLGKSSNYYILWVCVCSLRYPACNAHAPYCHLWPAQVYNIFPHYLINDTIFRRKKLLQIKCVFFLYNICLKHFSFWDELSDIWSKMYAKYLLFFSDFNETWIFLTHLQTNAHVSNFMKICPLGAEFFRVDRRTDRQTQPR
jgi:hypothetical protein